MKEFQVISRLGEGSYSSVWKVKRKSDGQEYAMKKVKLAALSQKEKENALNEVRILASINNPHIIGYKEAFLDDDSMTLCIVMEYAAGGDIYQKILQHQKAKTYFKEEDIWRYTVQMILGLKALHDMKILHRDLKCANVFISKDHKTVKLGDLNVSKITKGNIARTQTGTPYYASPEVWKDLPYDAKSDIWSLGCVVYEMCALKPPFRANDMQGLYKKVQKGVYDRIPSYYSSDLSTLISMCLQVSPSLRPLCDQLLKHPIIEKHAKEYLDQLGDIPEKFQLLNTIKFPKNVKALGKQLPKPKYSDVRSVGDIDESKAKNLDSERNERNVFSSNGRRVLNQIPPLGLEEKINILQMASPKERRDYLSQQPKENKNQPKRDRSQDNGSIITNSSESGSKNNLPLYRNRRRKFGEDKENVLIDRAEPIIKPIDHKKNISKLLDPLPSIHRKIDSNDTSREESYRPPLSNKHEYIINKYQNDYKSVDRSIDKKIEERILHGGNAILSRRAEYLLQKYNADLGDKSPSGKNLPKVQQSPSQASERAQVQPFRKIDYNQNYNRYDRIVETPRSNILVNRREVDYHQRGVLKPAWWG